MFIWPMNLITLYLRQNISLFKKMSLTMVHTVLYLFRGKKINSEGTCSRLLSEKVTFRAPRGGGCEAGVGGKWAPSGV